MHQTDNISLAIVGLGYVGLPLAVEFGKLYSTVGFDINQSRVDEIFGSALRNKAIPASKHDRVRQEWDEPKHDEFKTRNAWSLFNSFTEVMKSSPNQLPKRTITLHRVFDEFCDVKMTLPESPELDLDEAFDNAVVAVHEEPSGFFLT